LKETLSPTKCY
jgi:hypothetical protein